MTTASASRTASRKVSASGGIPWDSTSGWNIGTLLRSKMVVSVPLVAVEHSFRPRSLKVRYSVASLLVSSRIRAV